MSLNNIVNNSSIKVNNIASNTNNSTVSSVKHDEQPKIEPIQGKEKEVNTKELKAAIDNANKVLFKNNTHLQFRIHEKTNEVMVKIVEDETGEVLKEIPPEKMLDMVAKLWEIAGILVDEKR